MKVSQGFDASQQKTRLKREVIWSVGKLNREEIDVKFLMI